MSIRGGTHRASVLTKLCLFRSREPTHAVSDEEALLMNPQIPKTGSPARGHSWKHSGHGGENMCRNGENLNEDVTGGRVCTASHPPARDSLFHTRCGGLGEYTVKLGAPSQPRPAMHNG